MAEIPVVVVDAQRAGPSTGMPTRHEQGDLFLAALGGHGEIQRIVLAPVSVVGLLHPGDQRLQPGRAVPGAGDPDVATRSSACAPRASRRRTSRSSRSSTGSASTATARTARTAARRRASRAATCATSSPRSASRRWRSRARPAASTSRPAWSTTRPAGRARTRTTTAQMTDKRFSKLELARAGRARRRTTTATRTPTIGILSWGSTVGHRGRGDRRWPQQKGIKVAAMAPRMLWPLPDHQLRRSSSRSGWCWSPRSTTAGSSRAAARPLPARPRVRQRLLRRRSFTVARLVQEIEGVHQHAR